MGGMEATVATGLGLLPRTRLEPSGRRPSTHTDPRPIPSFHPTETAMLNLRLTTWAAALFTTLSYLLCVVYGLVTPESIHMHQFLEIVLPAFEWIGVGSFLLGLAESFLWGVYLGGGFALIHNALYRRWGTRDAAGLGRPAPSGLYDPSR